MSWDRTNAIAAAACGIAPRSTNGWPSHDVVAPKLELAVQTRRTVCRAAQVYNDRINRIIMLLSSSSAALADYDYIRADNDRHEAWKLLCGASELIDEAEREMCLPTDGCEFCGAPSAHRCDCDIPYGED